MVLQKRARRPCERRKRAKGMVAHLCSLPITLHIKEPKKTTWLTKAKVNDANILIFELFMINVNSEQYGDSKAIDMGIVHLITDNHSAFIRW
jgi:hypothetical protein